jgi:hypothetical protein
MIRNFRIALMAASSAAVLFAMPTPSYAIFHWFRNMCGGCGQPAAVAPAVVEAPLAAPTVVNYVPQTCYRTQYVTVPVTTYRPSTGCDPCTGCPITTMRPVVSYVQQARMVPYTTYRAVVTSGCSPCGGAVTAGYAPVASYAAPASSCSGCSAAAAPASMPYYNSAPMSVAPSAAAPLSSAPAGSSTIGAPTLAPGVSPGTSSFQQRPIISSESTTVSPESRQKPIVLPGPDLNNGASNGLINGGSANGGVGNGGVGNTGATSAAPQLINPDDRSTQRLSVPVRYAVHRISTAPNNGAFTPIDWPRDTAARAIQVSANEEPAPQPELAPELQLSPARPIDADGWRPSSR